MSFSSRLERFVRSLSDEASSPPRDDDAPGGGRFGGYTFDPEYAEAMHDLEHFIRHGFDRADGEFRGAGDRAHAAASGGAAGRAQIPTAVRRAFRALETEAGADFAAVNRSYKRLIAGYHPDKHASNPDRAAAATEVSKRLNLAYRAIRDYYIVTGRIDP